MMKAEVVECLSEYCKFGENLEIETKYDDIIYKRFWAKINDYFEAGVTLKLFEDSEKKMNVQLVVY